MNKLMTIARQFRDDENGAAMIEYSILLGVLAVTAITAVIFVGNWVGAQWTALDTGLRTTPTQP